MNGLLLGWPLGVAKICVSNSRISCQWGCSSNACTPACSGHHKERKRSLMLCRRWICHLTEAQYRA